MKKIILLVVLITGGLGYIYADSGGPVALGVHAVFGGRYDNLRMCVGSAAGVKGGPIADIYLVARFPAGQNGKLGVNLPIMRPILFAAAFGMLQFEPQVTYEYSLQGPGNLRTVLGGGLGVSIHYVPDYTSSRNYPGEPFFAAGPFISGSAGLVPAGTSGVWMPGLKIFYAPLFLSLSPNRNGYRRNSGAALQFGRLTAADPHGTSQPKILTTETQPASLDRPRISEFP